MKPGTVMKRANGLAYAIQLYHCPAMVRPGNQALAISLVAFLAVVSGAKAQTDIWGGGFPSDKVSVGSNWVGGVVPAGISAGSDTLVFNDASDSNMKINQTGVSFAGIMVTDPLAFGNNANIYGTNTLSIGSGGITQVESGEDSINTYIGTPIALTATQPWTTVEGGYIQVTGAISGSYALNLVGGYNQEFEFDSGSSTFSGGVTVSGSGTILAVGATGTPFGTGPLALGDGVSLEPTTPTAIVLPNAVSFGDGTGTGTVSIGGNPNADFPVTTSVTFNGNATFNQDTTESMDSEVDLYPNTTVTFTGNMSGGGGGVCIDFGTINSAANAVVILQGNFGTGLQRFDVEDNVSVIFDPSNESAQIASIEAHIEDIGTSNAGYLGLGKNYVGNVAAFLAMPQIQANSFQGTLGFDTTSGTAANFTDSINLNQSIFNLDGGFVGVGSATKAIISGTITPPGGLTVATDYPFGGGGGYLQVTSALVDSNNDGDISNNLWLSPGNGPLTLVLTGAGTAGYTGGTYVDGGALIFDTAVPTTGGIYLGERKDTPGYVGATSNSQFSVSNPQAFIGMIDNESTGVVGFDYITGSPMNISGPINMGSLPNVFLGTATAVTYSGSISPNDSGVFQFSGVKGGQVTVMSTLSGENSVVAGLPSPIESYGSVSSVVLAGDNSYSGNTTLNSGYLYVGTPNSIGATGSLIVPDPGKTGTTIGLAPYQTSVELDNAISIPSQGIHLNYVGSPYTLTLGGPISDYSYGGSLIVDGPVVLNGNNSFSGNVTVNGTTLTLGSDQALWDAYILQANSGSTIVFSSQNPYVDELNLTNSSASFTYTGEGPSSPEIDYLQMELGSQLTFAAGSSPSIYGMSSDAPNSGNLITLNANTALYISLEADPDYHGTIVGPSSSSIELASGTLNLAGSNTGFSGTVTIDYDSRLIASNSTSPLGTGPVVVSGTLATNIGAVVANPITLNDGGTLAGFGTFSPGGTLLFENSSTLIPGAATLTGLTGPSSIPVIGTLSFGGSTSLDFSQGGNLIFGITDANGAAGVGYSTISVAGGLNISATSLSPFNISIYSYTPGMNTVSSPANFNPSQFYSWTLVSAAGGITNFNAGAFNINYGNFSTSTGTGGFYVTEIGNDLMLDFSPVPEPSTWALMGSGVFALGTILVVRRRHIRTLAAPGR